MQPMSVSRGPAGRRRPPCALARGVSEQGCRGDLSKLAIQRGGGKRAVVVKKPWARGGLRTYVLVLALVFGRPEQQTTLWGLPLLLCGLLLHVYAKGSLRQDRIVAQGGPYRFVRHPFYAANLLIDQSIALMSGWAPLIVLLPLWWLAVYVPAMRQEERHLTALFPDDYPAYRARVPMLLPFRRPLPRRASGFSWRNSNIVADTVVSRALRIAALPLIFVLCRAFRTHGVSTFTEAHGYLSLVAALVVLAYGLSWMLTRHLKHRRPILPLQLSRPAPRLIIAWLVVVAAGAIHAWELEGDVILPLAGRAMIGFSAVLRARSSPARLAAEGTVVAAATLLCEVLWLTPLPVLLYAALILDRRLAGRDEADLCAELPRASLLISSYLYSFLLVSSLLSAAAKELLV